MTNSSSGPLAFKVKTTAPKLYVVRPNASIIQPGESVKVMIILQAFNQPLSKHYKCKDKFLIVSLPCPADAEAAKVGEFWNALEKANKSQLISKKLRVNYIIEESEDDKINEEKIPDQDNSIANNAIDTSATDGEGAAAVGAAGAAGVAAGATASGVSSGHSEPIKRTEKSVDDKELDDSYNQINKLNEKFDKTESEPEQDSENTKVKSTGDEPFSGVSLPLTFILMILAFIIGWAIF